jgi:ADP-ribosylglycohydrolase
MRVAPLGAYFADDLDQVVDQALLSAQVTHLHPEGQAGAVAIALAAAYAWRCRHASESVAGQSLLEFVEARTPPGEVRHGIRQALAMPKTTSVTHAAAVLGSGYRISAQDTVPFCLWVAARNLGTYEEAVWQTVSALGDRDTTCAIVGGIVVLSAGLEAIPEIWMVSREGLSLRYKPGVHHDDL